MDYSYTYSSLSDRPMRDVMESTMYRGERYKVAKPDRRRTFAILMLESSLLSYSGTRMIEKENIAFFKVQALR